MPGSEHDTVARRSRPCVLTLTAVALGDGLAREHRGGVVGPVPPDLAIHPWPR
jgi:hypothetical protein